MRKLALLAAVVCLLSCYGRPALATEAQWSESVFRDHYVGPSTSKTTGAAGGWVGISGMCQNTYGPTAHICTMDEYFISAPGPATPSEKLWVWPSYHNCVYDTVKSELYCQCGGSSTWVNMGPPSGFLATGAATGSPNEERFSCSSYTDGTSAATGWVIDLTLGPKTAGRVSCIASLHVACCTP
jgi:hypothetical protein